MYNYIKNCLLILICICALQNNAQPPFNVDFDGKYTITIGDKRITPSENVDKYTTLKKELANNLHEDYYHVVIQFNNQPNLVLKSQMAGKIINELAISKNTYIAAVTKNINTRKLKKLDVRAILLLSPEMKINPTVLQSETETVKINIVTPKHIDQSMMTMELDKYNAKFKLKFMADSVNKYTYSVEKSSLKAIASLPWVLQIEEGGMR